MSNEKQLNYYREWREKNRDKVKSYSKKYYYNNIEKRREESRLYAEKNKEKYIKNAIKWNKDNPERYKEIKKQYKKRNEKKCKEWHKNWAKKNPERYKKYREDYLNKPGVKERYKKYMENYNLRRREKLVGEPKPEKCPVCGRKPDKNRKGKGKICVDHCHKTGKIRGWLCDDCNCALGRVDDKIDILKGLIKYLKKYEDIGR